MDLRLFWHQPCHDVRLLCTIIFLRSPTRIRDYFSRSVLCIVRPVVRPSSLRPSSVRPRCFRKFVSSVAWDPKCMVFLAIVFVQQATKRKDRAALAHGKIRWKIETFRERDKEWMDLRMHVGGWKVLANKENCTRCIVYSEGQENSFLECKKRKVQQLLSINRWWRVKRRAQMHVARYYYIFAPSAVESCRWFSFFLCLKFPPNIVGVFWTAHTIQILVYLIFKYLVCLARRMQRVKRDISIHLFSRFLQLYYIYIYIYICQARLYEIPSKF